MVRRWVIEQLWFNICMLILWEVEVEVEVVQPTQPLRRTRKRNSPLRDLYLPRLGFTRLPITSEKSGSYAHEMNQICTSMSSTKGGRGAATAWSVTARVEDGSAGKGV